MSKGKPIRCFMDGIDWEHHLGSDYHGTRLFPSEKSLREGAKCVTTGGCGIVEVEVRLVRWAEAQNLKYKKTPTKNLAAIVARNKKAARTRAKMKTARAKHQRGLTNEAQEANTHGKTGGAAYRKRGVKG